MIVKDINTDAYESPYLFADGYVGNINTSVYLGLEREVKIQNYYYVFYKIDGKDTFLIKKNFKFNPIKYLIYGILEILGLPFFVLILFKSYKYFKNEKLDY